MKRFLLWGLAVLFLSGCGYREEQKNEKPPIVRAETLDTGTVLITVGFIQTGKESDWRDANTNDFLQTFTREKGYNLIYIDGNSDPERQVKAAYDLIAQNVDYIIIDPIVEDGWEDVFMEAKEKGIPVIVSDRQVNVNASHYACWVGSDFYKEGQNAAKWLEDYLEEKGREKEEIKIVLLEGTDGATATRGRTEGLYSVIDRHPNWKVVAKEFGNFTQGEGAQVMEGILNQKIAFDVVIAENDNMMFGAMNAMDQQGIVYGNGTDIITISFDALHEALAKVIKGELMVTVECNPLIAGLSEKAILDLEKGRRIEKVHFVQETVFTQENTVLHLMERKY
ncbi:MAG: ABC transporter substrate-binding protein [Lachnospiraceae bacterium]|nr:ABC transporter substrate-binding protein [Lachnospiraceae bacterium]MDE6980100.1 ABC transporter substrate-binding protein [Lachnospiraceae bacterium]